MRNERGEPSGARIGLALVLLPWASVALVWLLAGWLS